MAQFDLSSLLQQAQAMQEKFKQMQEEIATKTVEAESGGGMVRVTADGSMRLRNIQIEPTLVTANDKEMLQDLIVVAVNDALRRAQELFSQEMSKLSPFGGALNIPGLFGGRE
ncbi:MAG TPA: YbaB/EbfC family nucleoid-associated protein [Candidatus Binataceae bacterium]|nr:YbaB/EbfC family nucleoid-associated protein [Candidatus Binataceae bacterium]